MWQKLQQPQFFDFCSIIYTTTQLTLELNRKPKFACVFYFLNPCEIWIVFVEELCRPTDDTGLNNQLWWNKTPFNLVMGERNWRHWLIDTISYLLLNTVSANCPILDRQIEWYLAAWRSLGQVKKICVTKQNVVKMCYFEPRKNYNNWSVVLFAVHFNVPHPNCHKM